LNRPSSPALAWDGVKRSYMPPPDLAIDPSLSLFSGRAEHVDPITYEVVRNALVSANFEHGALLEKLCVSPVILFGRDFQTSLLSADGELACMGPNLQYFGNGAALVAKWTLENRSANPGIRPGDMFFNNDAYIGSPHQNDCVLLAPVFVGDQLFAWVSNIMHHMDVGGAVPKQNSGATDIWQEAPLFPSFKLVENRVPREDLLGVFVRQSRLPLMIECDLRAAIAACETTRGKIEALAERYGAATVQAVLAGALDAGEALFRSRLATIPDGRWSHRVYTEACVPGDRGVYCYQTNITKRGDRLVVDNRGTDPQAGAISLTFGPYSGAVFSALTSQLAADLAGVYGGVYRCVEFDLEPGRLSSPDYPAPISYTGANPVGSSIYTAVLTVGKMISCSRDPEVRALALGPTIPHFYTNGLEFIREDGSLDLFSSLDGMMGSLGAMPGRDGVAGGGHSWIPECIAPNIENYEQQSSLLFLYRRYLAGGADGAGRTRGGLGVEQAFVAHGSSGGRATSHMNESFAKSQGQWGGNPGSRAFFQIHRGVDLAARLAASDIPAGPAEIGGTVKPMRYKGAAEAMGPTDIVEWASPTTAGWGDPLSRDPEAAADDVRSGDFTRADAERVYGVRFTEAGAPDLPATAALRRRLRAERMGAPPKRDPAPVGVETSGLAVGDCLVLHRGRWACRCGQDLGPQGANYKDAAAFKEKTAQAVSPEFQSDDPEMADQIVFREWLCPGCGVRLDTELARRGDPVLHDVAIDDLQAEPGAAPRVAEPSVVG
jgi:N-methylhydantoinase B